MKRLLPLSVFALFTSAIIAQQIPLRYDVENSGLSINIDNPSNDYQNALLPDPFLFNDGSYSANFLDWERHRNEIAQMVMDNEIGPRPTFKKVDAHFCTEDSTITLSIDCENGQITLTSKIIIPQGEGPFPIVIGMQMPSGSIRPQYLQNCILIPFKHDQIIKSSHQAIRDTTAQYYKIFPQYTHTSGNYSGWSWAISRLIDGLYLINNQIKGDLNHIAVTGCSYAGKMAMFAGAFDERIALTIIQESGGGGINAWRVSEYYTATTTHNVEKIDNTNYSWFSPSLKEKYNGKVEQLPYDHHQIISMIAPRAVLILGNPDFEWLCDYSGLVSCFAASRVWDQFGIGDRFGYVIQGGHNHCMACDEQNNAVVQFVNKFLFNKEANTQIRYSDKFENIDTNYWIKNWKSETSNNK